MNPLLLAAQSPRGYPPHPPQRTKNKNIFIFIKIFYFYGFLEIFDKVA
jgi:hypothetical protein